MINKNIQNFNALLTFLNDAQFRSEFQKNPIIALRGKNLSSLERSYEVRVLSELGLEELAIVAALNTTSADVYENIGAGVIF